MQISVIIPAYNEESVIAETLHEVAAYLKEHFSSYEIIVVNDGSKDRTCDIVSRISDVRLVQNDRNRGKGYTVRHGMLEASGDLLLFMDADNSTRIIELDHFVPEIRDYDIVIASRALRGSHVEVHQNPLKRMLGRLGNAVIRGALGVPFQDTQCGFKLFRKETKHIFEQQTVERWGFDFELVYLAHRAGYRIYESPVRWVNNFDSKVTMWSYLGTLYELFSIRLRHLFSNKR